MKAYTSHTTNCTPTTYAETLAYSLIAFANVNKDFSRWLIGEVSTLPDTTQTSPSHFPSVPLTISTETQAVQRALWLIDTLHTTRVIGYKHATEILVSWAHTREKTEPKMAILGLKYGILDYGIWGQPLKKETPIHILIQNSVYSESNNALVATQCVFLANRLLEQALLTADGNAYRLEPEMHDWLFGEKHIVLHTGTSHTLQSVANEAKRFAVPIATIENDATVAYVALSPSCTPTDFVASQKLQSCT